MFAGENFLEDFPLEFVWVSCHDVDLDLLSIAKRTPGPFAFCIIASVLFKLSSICRFISKCILAIIILPLSLTASSNTVCSSESCHSNKKSV